MRLETRKTLLPVICFFAVAARAQNTDLSGKWQVTIMHYGQAEYARLTLKATEGRWTGETFGDAFTISAKDSVLEVRFKERTRRAKVAARSLAGLARE